MATMAGASKAVPVNVFAPAASRAAMGPDSRAPLGMYARPPPAVLSQPASAMWVNRSRMAARSPASWGGAPLAAATRSAPAGWCSGPVARRSARRSSASTAASAAARRSSAVRCSPSPMAGTVAGARSLACQIARKGGCQPRESALECRPGAGHACARHEVRGCCRTRRRRRLTIGDETLLSLVLSWTSGAEASSRSGLDERSTALVRVAPLIVAGGSGPADSRAVDEAIAMGAEPRGRHRRPGRHRIHHRIGAPHGGRPQAGDGAGV